MASKTVNAFYDTMVRKGYDNNSYESDSKLFCSSRDIIVLQFDMPSINDVIIESAYLNLYVYNTGSNITITPAFYDITTCLTNFALSYNYYSYNFAGLKVLDAQEKLSYGTAVSNYNRWVQVNITNLVVGYLGRKNYSIVLNGKFNGGGGSTTISSKEGGHIPYITINYSVAMPYKPTVVYPNGEALSNTGTVRCQWKYNAGTSTTGQTKYEIGWKMQSDVAWTTTTVTSGNQYHDLNATAFRNGIVEWRVRTYNASGMVSDYANAQFYVIGKPANPVISGVKNDAITEIIWSANKSEEAAARVKIIQNSQIIHDSGKIPAGHDDIYRPDIILDNGAYAATLSISNTYGMWSDEISKTFNISRTRPSIPALKVSNMEDHINISITGNSAVYFIYRSYDGHIYIPIAKTTDKEYRDYIIKPGTRYRYYIRAYNGAYMDSAIADTCVDYTGYYLCALTNPKETVHFVQHESERYIPISITSNYTSSNVYYIGRTYPVKEAGEQRARRISLEAYLTDEEIAILKKLHDKNDVYCLRGKAGVFYCDITGFNYKNSYFNQGYLVSIEFECVDYREAVDFHE